MSEKDGGPAFPWTDPNTGNGGPGMSLRDWFAGQCLNGLSARSGCPIREDGETYTQAEVRIAYEYADAVLEQREK